ncbi:aminoglycoside phosphotransferase family protein [Kribbella hippodromi]|uniref:Aminoglycoside phosphotransferase family protein n=1 Tax=Kribbella hippodromi TaxID=434347 RepID=A0ABP4Q2D1_9ACTN
MTVPPSEVLLKQACAQVGLASSGAEPIRLGENAIYRLPGEVVVRIGRSGQLDAAKKEVAVARWLASVEIRAVEVVSDVDQPVVIDGSPVTFWRELPEHRHGTPPEVAEVLKRLHASPLPTDFDLPPLAPFVRLSERIDSATTLSEDDRTWLRGQLARLTESFADLPAGLQRSAIHGDAWAGNIVVTDDGPVLLDLERFSLGPPEWDLVSTAVRLSTFGTMTAEEYRAFAATYGHDVLEWDGFEVLRGIRELRVTCYAAQRASEEPSLRPEAELRVASIRGRRGPRPWPDWKPLS